MTNRYTTSTTLYGNAIYGLTSTIIPTSVVDYHIQQAEAQIDSYLCKQYVLPFSSVPPMVSRIANDLSAYNVLNYLYSQQNQNVNDWVKGLGETNIEMLKALSVDDMRLTYETGSQPTMYLDISMATNMEDIPLVANMDNVMNWGVSTSLENQIFDDRAAAGGTVNSGDFYYDL